MLSFCKDTSEFSKNIISAYYKLSLSGSGGKANAQEKSPNVAWTSPPHTASCDIFSFSWEADEIIDWKYDAKATGKKYVSLTNR